VTDTEDEQYNLEDTKPYFIGISVQDRLGYPFKNILKTFFQNEKIIFLTYEHRLSGDSGNNITVRLRPA
jgi:hypothetical protein